MISDKGITIKFLLLVLVCLSVSGDAEARCKEREREALLSFKNGLIDDDGILSSWRGDECCKWDGVVCSNTTGHVIALHLDAVDYYTKLRGKVGSSLLELHHLNYLDLSYNDFGGNPIPEFIGSMKQLQHLYLRDSEFSGIVPPQIGNLTNLRSLDLSAYSLRTDQNLDWLSSLSLLSFLGLSSIDLSHTNWLHHILSLQFLHKLYLVSSNLWDVEPSARLFVNSSSSTSLSILGLSDNHLTCSSFDWLSNISTSLVKIYLSYNALSCPIPNVLLERMILVDQLDLSGNMLEGEIPKSLGNLSRLEQLDLSGNMLEGEIPKSLGNLSRLRVLVLRENSLRGHLDDELFGNVSAKGILESLQILNLGDNKLNGSVPDLRAFSALTELYLGGNNFTGSMPLSLGQLSKLEFLDLSRNLLEGSVSESHFIKLDKLKRLDLSFNSLTLHVAPDWSPPFQLKEIFLAGCNVGLSFPKWIQTQKNLSTLDLSRAGIADEAPKWLWTTSPLLEGLILSDNQIRGTIPNLSSTSISIIDVSNNRFSGPIPLFYADVRAILLNGNMFSGSISSICKVTHDQFWVIDLSNNELGEEVPNCWEKMPILFALNLNDNGFLGEIPRSLGSLHNLAALQLRGNNLSGELPSTLRLCQNLELMDVGGNGLIGEIPAWIGNMYKMAVLNLGRNKLHGSIPLGICNLTDIRTLDLSINNLSGKIPHCNNFTALAQKRPDDLTLSGYLFWLPNRNPQIYYQSSSFQWKGQESEYKETLKLLKLIDFSSNRLTGNIPQSFSSMRALISLNLSRNSLTGNIIPDIGGMEMLEILDLSRNHLSGKIPTSLAQLHYLAVVDLSNNNLSGKIPTSTQLQSFNTSSYAGNNGLCGPPLELCPPSSTTAPGENMNEKDGIFSFMQEVGISMAFGFILGFWGVVGPFILKKSWRIAYFNFLDAVGDWFYVRSTIFVSKWRPSSNAAFY